ncbi:TetR/AcrR family transcriptional regulator [Oceanicella actignis]|uniref:Transcriptional regulator, TetR family n=1 Tax=Oceanicella actignis TaxID=1189325 RepID=A0A1M7SVK9_9RHOB|nr:TetR/AcrR family transcriptional regulator [Oceanicella actignis]SES72621.1 transcriptional regulator, TetR family [Oceanicella actignis]SHN62424.1 transcriptional regulator, TetR family [Oceanicella actignis]
MGPAAGKREQIVEAAVDEFLERGYLRASMDRIAARAQVSKRTVYNHFDGKLALFNAIVDRMSAQLSVALDLRFDPAAPVAPQLRALAWAEGRLMMSPDFMRLARMVMGETMRDPALAAEMAERLDKCAPIAAFMADAARAGALRVDDPERAAAEFLSLLKGQGFWPVIHGGAPLDERAMEAVVDSAVRMILARYGQGAGQGSGQDPAQG